LRKLVWFGYGQNIHYLINTFDILIRKGIELTLISNISYEPPLIYRDKLKLHNIPYSQETLNKELIEHDAILMPAPFGDQKSKYKSNNKTLISWSIGMPVVTTPEELEKFMSKEVREKESIKRLKEVEEKWDSKISVAEYKLLLKEILAKKS